MDRADLARQARALLAKAYVSRNSLAEAAGISVSSMRIALAPKTAERSASLPRYLRKLADALEQKANELHRLADEMRTLAESAD